MNSMEILAAKAHATRAAYRRKIEQAQEIIDSGFRACSSPYVAFSCGKDSSVLLHLVQRVYPSIEARFIRWTESQLLDDFERVIGEWRQRSINLQILDLHRASINDKGGDRWGQLQQLSPCDGFFIGLRSQESKARKMTLAVHGTVYRMAAGLVRIAPLAWWNTDDVAAYCVQHQLPLLDAYQADGFNQRTSARVPREIVRSEALHALKVRDPQRWALLCQQYPEVMQYA